MHPSHVSAALLLLFLRPHACAAVGGPEPSSAPGPVEGAEGEEECSFADTRLLQVSHSLAGSALENVTSAQAGNLCIEGKQVPELYLLGEPKAASTSVAQAFEDVGAVAAVQSDYAERPWWHQLPPNRRLSPRGHLVADKERHFFDDWLELYKPTDPRLLPDFLSQLPACGEAREVLADFTAYLSMTPPPPGALFTGYNYGHLSGTDLPYTDVPWMLRKIYGGSSPRLAFVEILREPLPRMQSQWYHAESVAFTAVCHDCKAPSFAAALAATVSRFEQSPHQYDDWLWESMPSLNLPWWHSGFDARQFHFYGTGAFGRSGFGPLCESVRQDLGVEWECAGTRQASQRNNTHSHPPLSEEPISAELRARFNRVFEADTRRLVEELANLQSQGAALVGFQGAAGSLRDVDAWLRQSW